MSKLQLHTFVVIALLGLTLTATKMVAPSHSQRVKTDFSAIPYEFGDWFLFSEPGFGPETQRGLPNSSLLLRMYENSDYSGIFELAIVYGVDLGNFHQPEICLEGQGLRSQSRHLVKIRNADTGKSFDAMSLIMESDAGRSAFVYWFMSEGTTSVSLGNYKTDVLMNRLLLRKTKPSAMIRLSMRVTDSDREAIDQLVRFGEAVMPYLNKELVLHAGGK